MRLAVVATAICISMVGFAAADNAAAAIRKTTNIPAEGLGPALTTLAKEFDFQVLYRTELVGKIRTEGVSGAMTGTEALERLLNGTGLTYRYLDDKTVTILPAGTTPSQEEGAPRQSTDDDPSGATSAAKEGKKSSSSGFRLAQVDQGTNSQSSPINGKA
jgi:iron complex outermembrane receptor protein